MHHVRASFGDRAGHDGRNDAGIDPLLQEEGVGWPRRKSAVHAKVFVVERTASFARQEEVLRADEPLPGSSSESKCVANRPPCEDTRGHDQHCVSHDSDLPQGQSHVSQQSEERGEHDPCDVQDHVELQQAHRASISSLQIFELGGQGSTLGFRHPRLCRLVRSSSGSSVRCSFVCRSTNRSSSTSHDVPRNR
eukprot:scaffold1401_cov330-Pavlova_lutheri.AAC.177